MSGSSDDRRQHPRIAHPFDAFRLGVVDTPLTLYDLSLGGCFINYFHDPPSVGRRFQIRIDLGNGEPLTLQVEVVFQNPGFGYAVRFLDLADDARASLEQALQRIADER